MKRWPEDYYPKKNVFDPEREGGGGGGGGGVANHKPTIPVYQRILKILAERFENDLAQNRPHLVGLIFGQPYMSLVKEQIKPMLSHLHHRSETYIDFFTIGFSESGDFDAGKYNETLKTFEQNTIWKHSGGTDLVLVNTTYDPVTKKVTPNFTEALAMTLEDVAKVEGYENLGIFFESTIRAAKENCGIESPAKVSDQFGGSLAKSAFKGLLASLVPSGMKKRSEGCISFCRQRYFKE